MMIAHLAGVLLAGASAASAAPQAPMLGFGAGSAQAERALEQRFDAALSTEEMRGWLRQMSSAPNNVGTAKDRENAEFMLALFRSWGWDAHIETFSILYATPRSEHLEMLAPRRFVASLREPPVAGDATSAQNDAALPPYAVYGADGDVTANLVYVNHGMPDDYLELARRGVDVRGRIVIARYGEGWRGLKVRLAQDHGAIGCLIYSDPSDDGYGAGDTYPAGGWRPAEGVQRGSVLDTPLYPGDPLTPGVASTTGATRVARERAATLPGIPVLPISAADAAPLLLALQGPLAPAAWRGALPFAYHLGPGAAQVRLAVQSDWRQTPIYDVIATLPGSESPDQWVLRGNHHDGWTYGAWDPLSGNTALLEEARVLGAMHKAGWQPRRTLVYASWDGEEPGWIGSTEWVEAHGEDLRAKGVAYVNSDVNARGLLKAGGTPALQRLVNEVAADVQDPESGTSVLARALAAQAVERYEKKAGGEPAAPGLTLDALGAGSDFTAFLDHAGLPALDLFYLGEDEQIGAYHSAYDTYDHFARFGDPDFAYERLEAQTVGHTVLRLAGADILPMQFADVAGALARAVRDLHGLVEERRTQAQALASLRDTHAFETAGDPRHPVAPPAALEVPPAIDLSALDAAVAALVRSAQAFDAAAAQSLAGTAPPPATLAALNARLRSLEMQLTDPAGLPRREWFKHLVYAPGRYSGYSAKTLPGVREAIEQARWDEANHYAGVTALAIDRYRQALDGATALLAPAR